MRFRLVIDEETREVDLDPSVSRDDDGYLASVSDEGNEKIRIAVLSREKDRIVISVNGKAYSIIQLGRTRASITFVANGKGMEAGRESVNAVVEEASRLASNKELIVSNFPARIVKLSIKPGDDLRSGETLIVLEAMKMEAQIKAPRDCTVEEVFVKEGEMVERGKPMIRLKFR